MKDLKVHSISIDELLTLLRTREWLVPQFQRDFVWSLPDCADFAQSVLAARPVGMVTIWEQPDESTLNLEPITLQYGKSEVSFATASEKPKRFYVVLDGRQRSQAAAMAFGGLRATVKNSKFCGRFYLDANETELAPRVVFLHQREIDKKGWTKEVDAIAEGMFPLSSDKEGEGVLAQWVRYIKLMNAAETYPAHTLPPVEIRSKRQTVVETAFDGLSRSRLAVYTVPSVYHLGEICEIFETLNTTGTKVSTVDLIHSWLFADTAKHTQPMLLRDWIAEVGEMDGAIGWATSKDRPELFVQIAAACYLAQAKKPDPRPVGAMKDQKITSVKSGDLLALPVAHWLALRDRAKVLAGALKDFQLVVGNGVGLFPWRVTPYPVSAGIYVGLKWRLDTEEGNGDKWGKKELDAVYRAFFWRNALQGRYDQGFLTKLGTDLAKVRDILEERGAHKDFNSWSKVAEKALDEYVGLPNREQLVAELADGTTAGAKALAFKLPMRVRVLHDLLTPDTSLGYPEVSAELHHIYPRKWCLDNATGGFGEALRNSEERDIVNAIPNLIPLSVNSRDDG